MFIYINGFVTEQRVTAQWRFAVSDLDFLRPSLVWLRITLIYCRDAWRLRPEDQGGSSRVRKTARNHGRGGAAIMIWGGWECMAAEELAIKREGGKFWSEIFGSCRGESCLWRRIEGRLCQWIPELCRKRSRSILWELDWSSYRLFPLRQ
jgi:hypothetical protein